MIFFRQQCVDCDQRKDNNHLLRKEKIITIVDKEKSPNQPEYPACTDLLVTERNGSITNNIIMDNIFSAGVSVDSGYVTSDCKDNHIINTEDSSQIVNYYHTNKQERIASRFGFWLCIVYVQLLSIMVFWLVLSGLHKAW